MQIEVQHTWLLFPAGLKSLNVVRARLQQVAEVFVELRRRLLAAQACALRPISVLRFWISEVFTQAKS